MIPSPKKPCDIRLLVWMGSWRFISRERGLVLFQYQTNNISDELYHMHYIQSKSPWIENLLIQSANNLSYKMNSYDVSVDI